MVQVGSTSPAFVIKAEELAALNHLTVDHPPPLLLEWINRGTDQTLQRTTVDMLLRTLYYEQRSPSVCRLHQSAGLRLNFRTEEERDQFAAAFDAARVEEGLRKNNTLTAIFDHREHANMTVADLIDAGVPKEAISVLWRTGQYVDADGSERQGHGKLSVAASVAGGGIAGALLGIAVIAIPGLGLIAAAGAASALSSVAAVSAAIGATGGAIARMLTDLDVEGNDSNYLARLIQRGKVFVAIDLRLAPGKREIAHQVISQSDARSNRLPHTVPTIAARGN